MIILGIETSCDDTSVALVEKTNDGFSIIAEKTASQIDIHKKYGGVVPEIAAREHAEAIMPVVEEVMKNQNKPDCIAVTYGPGLITSLLVGVEAAKALSYLWEIPIVAVNHIDGHIHSVEIINSKIEFPALALVASGGHTELILMRERGIYELVGKTLDDAAGECFDKTAKLLGFDYPGGPKISQFAQDGNPNAINFPRPMLKEKNFSFSGLKTSALYWLRDNSKPNLNDFCASFEQAIVDVLVEKTLRSSKQFGAKTIILAGGVSANKKLRETLEKTANKKLSASKVLFPNLNHCMDNGAMIAIAGYYGAKKKKFADWRSLRADPNLSIGEK